MSIKVLLKNTLIIGNNFNQNYNFLTLLIFVFFSIAHTIHESVTEQASILVNGNLKEYQIKVILIHFRIITKKLVKNCIFILGS